MSTDYGTDIRALDDLPDPEVLTSGEENAAYAEARRLITPDGVYEEIGDLTPYDCLDLRDWLGKRPTTNDKASLKSQATQVLTQDPRAAGADVDVSFVGEALELDAQIEGTDGPFSLVLAVDQQGAHLKDR
jgi:hypothetical protein